MPYIDPCAISKGIIYCRFGPTISAEKFLLVAWRFEFGEQVEFYKLQVHGAEACNEVGNAEGCRCELFKALIDYLIRISCSNYIAAIFVASTAR